MYSHTALTSSLRMSTVVEPTPDKEEKQEEEEVVVEQEAHRSRELTPGLMDLPALKFITRKDLYTFLSSAGVSNVCVRVVGVRDMCVRVAKVGGMCVRVVVVSNVCVR